MAKFRKTSGQESNPVSDDLLRARLEEFQMLHLQLKRLFLGFFWSPERHQATNLKKDEHCTMQKCRNFRRERVVLETC